MGWLAGCFWSCVLAFACTLKLLLYSTELACELSFELFSLSLRLGCLCVLPMSCPLGFPFDFSLSCSLRLPSAFLFVLCFSFLLLVPDFPSCALFSRHSLSLTYQFERFSFCCFPTGFPCVFSLHTSYIHAYIVPNRRR